MADSPNHAVPSTGKTRFCLALGVIAAPLVYLFFRSFVPGLTLFANDGPLGAVSSNAVSMPGTFWGLWQDLNWLGIQQPSALPNISAVIFLTLGNPLGPAYFLKFYAPLSMLILGLCAWLFFRQMRLAPVVCIIGGLAAALNANFFSNACWGLPTRALTLANVFLALAALQSISTGRPFLKAVLAGVAVGLSLMEGYDVAAIFSLYVAAYALFVSLVETGNPARKWINGGWRIAVVAVVAGVVAAQALTTLVGTQVKGIVQTQKGEKNSEQTWDWATQWSLPKAETLRVIIPGLFGYRMDTPEGGKYWGTVGQQPGWPMHHKGFPRHSGAGEYAGILVVLLAAWAVAQAARKKDCPFSRNEKHAIFFWAGLALLSLVIAYGRHAPVYRIIYSLPFSSFVRGPLKFMHPFHLCLMILFAYGLNDLYRRYMERASASVLPLKDALKKWWATVSIFEKRWTFGCLAFLAVSLLGFLVYASSGPSLVQHLQQNGFSPEDAGAISRFSIGEVAWYCLFLVLALLLFIVTLSGAFSGPRARWGLFALGFLLAIDLARANTPWINYYDYEVKYASNPVLEILKEKPWEHRVTAPPYLVSEQAYFFAAICNEWLQHHFQYYNIQSLDVIQMRSEPVDHQAYMASFTTMPGQLRLWELTNTRYILGMRGFLDSLNNQLDPERKRFRVHAAFDFTQSADGRISTVVKPEGNFALFEFTGALPRVSLYSHWQVVTNEDAVLSQLVKPDFNPAKTVLVSEPLPAAESAPATNQPAGTANITHYEPKRLEMSANASHPCVLLLNDRFDPNWKVWVDGQPEKMVRCNYLMRGVFLKPGQHTVVFRFVPSIDALYVSLAGIGLGFVCCMLLGFSRRPANDAKA